MLNHGFIHRLGIFLINKYLKLIEVLFHAKYTICEFYQENWLTWAAPGQNSEKDTP